MDNYYLACYTVRWTEESELLNGRVNKSSMKKIKFEATDDGLARKIADEKCVALYNQYFEPPAKVVSEVTGVTLDTLMYIRELIKKDPERIFDGGCKPNCDSEYYSDNDPKPIWGA